jgi:hypothetical protein
MGKLTALDAERLSQRKGRYGDGGGLFLRVLTPGRRTYWTYRFRFDGQDREISVGIYPEMLLDEARQTHLYRHYDFEGRLIYIGVTNNVFRRWDKHKHTSTWADQVATITIEHYPTREAAERAEADAIIAERPRLNGHVLLNRWEREEANIRRTAAARDKVRRKPEAVAP